MRFDARVKAKVLVRCARICCLCWKQCGTNIEVAHIVPGSQDENDAIPLCFDCHQEIGAYDPSHPRGNRFRPEELRARRDHVYGLVESGVLQALVIASRLQQAPGAPVMDRPVEELQRTIASFPNTPSGEGREVLKSARLGSRGPEALPRMMELLNETDGAYVLDQLIESMEDMEAMSSLMAILRGGRLGDQALPILEQVIRKATFSTSAATVAAVMESAPSELLTQVDPGLRAAFFSVVLDAMNRDQFDEINKITPAVVKVHEAVPEELREPYVEALFDQAYSQGWHAAPAAQRALRALPRELAGIGLRALGVRKLLHDTDGHYRVFIENHRQFWPAEKERFFADFLSLSLLEFQNNYDPDPF